MRSWRELAVAAALAGGACSSEPGGGVMPPDEEVCRTSFVDYDNFGAPFVLDWCRGCHSASLPAAMRQGSPPGVNFDSQADVLAWSDRIVLRAGGDPPTMPPAGGPSDEERALLVEWLGCGGK